MDLLKVRAIVELSRRSRLIRSALLPSDRATRESAMIDLRGRMFNERKEGSNAFNPLSEYDLAVLEWQIEKYARAGSFKIAGDGDPGEELLLPMDVLRHDHLLGRQEVSPQMFRRAAAAAIRVLLGMMCGQHLGLRPETTTSFMAWRGSMAFAMPAFEWGCRSWQHLDVARNEKTAQAEAYYHSPFVLRMGHIYLSADPMLATGGTQIMIIKWLVEHGVRAEDIVVIALVSAPEGVDRILSTFPGVRIFTAGHDERLNSQAYIEPGLGDFGDKYFEDFCPANIAVWCGLGILNVQDHKALLARMSRAA